MAGQTPRAVDQPLGSDPPDAEEAPYPALAFFYIAATLVRLFFYNARWILRGRNGFDGVDVRPRLRVELLGKLVKHLETYLISANNNKHFALAA